MSTAEVTRSEIEPESTTNYYLLFNSSLKILKIQDNICFFWQVSKVCRHRLILLQPNQLSGLVAHLNCDGVMTEEKQTQVSICHYSHKSFYMPK